MGVVVLAAFPCYKLFGQAFPIAFLVACCTVKCMTIGAFFLPAAHHLFCFFDVWSHRTSQTQTIPVWFGCEHFSTSGLCMVMVADVHKMR